jgi:hypothetical protein
MSDRIPYQSIYGSMPLEVLMQYRGLTQSTARNWMKHGVPPCKVLSKIAEPKRPQGWRKQNHERNQQMADMYRSGKTLEEIGSQFNISRERVRQCIKDFGLNRDGGGATVRKLLIGKRRSKYEEDQRFLPYHGCTYAEARKINGGLSISIVGTPSQRFREQKRNAGTRGIEWNFTLPEWWRVWQESGKWDQRGRGQGYCMSRIGDTGAYELGNVEIKTIGENFSESYFKHPWAKRFGGIHTKKTHCSRGHELTPENSYIYTNKDGDSHRQCRECRKVRAQQRQKILTQQQPVTQPIT